MAQVLNITDAQLQTLMNGVHAGGKRLSTFSSADPSEWRVWRANFVAFALAHDWLPAKQRNMLRTHFEGDAHRATQGVDFGAPRAVADILVSLDAAFLPAAASKLARSEFKKACQLPTETTLAWKGRVRELYIRANPNHEDTADDEIALIECFCEGLYDTQIAHHTQDRDPQTLPAALRYAQNKEANLASHQTKSGRTGGAKLHQIAPLETLAAVGAPGSCWNCGSMEHFKSDCPKPVAAATAAWRGGGRGRNMRGRGGRGAARGKRARGASRGAGGGGRGRGGRRGGRKINSLEGAEGGVDLCGAAEALALDDYGWGENDNEDQGN